MTRLRPGQSGETKTRRRTTMLLAAMLVATTVAAYWGISQNGFVRYDDEDYITSNYHVMQGLSWEGVKWAFTSFHAANWHPLTWLSHMLDWQLFGNWAGGHHLVGLALHILSTLLLLAFLTYTTGRRWASAFVAALFALHPLHVESVAWAAERKDVLSTFFWFATMLMYAFYAKKPGIVKYAGVILLYGLGLMSKPMLVTLPIVLLLLDYWPLERFEIVREGWRLRMTGTSARHLIIEKLPLLLMAAISSAITLKAQVQTIATMDVLSFWARLANATVSYGRYIWGMVWPSGLTIFYPFATSFFYVKLAAAILLIGGCSGLALYLARSRKYMLVGWFWYLITLVPVIGIVQVGWQSHADRYTYVPLVGLFVAIAWTAAQAIENKRVPRGPVAVTTIAILLGMGLLTSRQVGYWKDDLTLFSRAMSVTSDNPMMLANLGAVLGERGRSEEGLAALKDAMKLLPNNDKIKMSIGDLLSRYGRFQEAIPYYEEAIKLQPRNKMSQMGMATALARLGRSQEAEGYCRKAIELDSRSGDAYNLLGIVLGQMKRMDESMAAFERAAESQPGAASARLNMARIHVERGNVDAAITECKKSIAMTPHYTAYDYLGEVLVKAGRLDEAELAYREAVRLGPDVAKVHYDLAVLLVGLGRRDEAIQEAEKASRLEPGNAAIREYLERISQPRKGD